MYNPTMKTNAISYVFK